MEFNVFAFRVFFLPVMLSASCRSARADLPDPLPPPFSIVHRSG